MHRSGGEALCVESSASPLPADNARHVVFCLADEGLTKRLVKAVEGEGFIAFVGEHIERSLEPLDSLESTRQAVLVVDTTSPDWLRHVSALVRERPTLSPVVLAQLEADGEFIAAIAAGVAGFCAPDASDAAIVRTIRAALEWGVAIPRAMVAPLVEHLRHTGGRQVQSATGPIDVTEREWQILQLLVQRRSTKEMANELFVSVGTVRSHVSALLRKLDVVDRDAAVATVEQL